MPAMAKEAGDAVGSVRLLVRSRDAAAFGNYTEFDSVGRVGQGCVEMACGACPGGGRDFWDPAKGFFRGRVYVGYHGPVGDLPAGMFACDGFEVVHAIGEGGYPTVPVGRGAAVHLGHLRRAARFHAVRDRAMSALGFENEPTPPGRCNVLSLVDELHAGAGGGFAPEKLTGMLARAWAAVPPSTEPPDFPARRSGPVVAPPPGARGMEGAA